LGNEKVLKQLSNYPYIAIVHLFRLG